jgi:hypothetical protein
MERTTDCASHVGSYNTALPRAFQLVTEYFLKSVSGFHTLQRARLFSFPSPAIYNRQFQKQLL